MFSASQHSALGDTFVGMFMFSGPQHSTLDVLLSGRICSLIPGTVH